MIKDDESNPWRWIKMAVVGQPSEIVLSDRLLGPIHVKGPVVLLDDGYWYLMDPPRQLFQRPVAWRYATKKPKGG